MTGQELFAEREAIKKRLTDSLQRAYDNGIESAEKTRLYRILLAQKILQLKADGVPVSIIDKIAKGSDEVAKAEFEMVVAEVKYKASNENIMAQKKLLEGIEADIRREYFRNEE